MSNTTVQMPKYTKLVTTRDYPMTDEQIKWYDNAAAQLGFKNFQDYVNYYTPDLTIEIMDQLSVKNLL